MTDSKYFPLVVVVSIVVALLFTAAFIGKGFSQSAIQVAGEPEYVNKVFDATKVTEINIEIDAADFNWLIENADKEEYRGCDVTINDASFSNVGIRPKGNSSLRTVMQDETTDRYSFKLEFDTYVEGQDCFGLNKISLNNILSDNTYMKEYLAYNLFETMGVVTPEYAYANITVNGEPWGLYLAVECLEEDFVERNYGSTPGNLYRPEGTGANLVWKGEAASNYSGIRDGAAYNVTDRDFKKVITMIENLNAGTDLEKYLDVDAVLRYFAVNTFLVNLDSYTGMMNHNYYLYEEDGVCTILPWDLNLAFAGFGIGNAEEGINHPIDTPVQGNISDRPLIGKLLEVPEYKELYHAYLQELVETYIDSGVYAAKIGQVDTLINKYVKNDVTAFCTYEEYQNSLPALEKFGELRAISITNQLTGKQSSTAKAATGTESPSAAGSGSVDTSKTAAKEPPPSVPETNRLPEHSEPNSSDSQNADNQVSAEGLDLKALGSMGNPAPPNGEIPPGEMPPQEQPEPGNGNAQDMPDKETMAKVMEIIMEGNGKELSEEQISKLKELGLDATMIERMESMPAGMNAPGDKGLGQGDSPIDMNSHMPGNEGISNARLAYVGVATGVLALGLLYAWKTKRRKFSS